MTIKTKQELLDSFADNQTQDIAGTTNQDLVDSLMGVGGGESNEGVDPQGNGTQNNLEIGNGLTSLGNRRLQVDTGADGLYRFEAQGAADIDIQANVFVAIVKNDITSGEGAPDYIQKKNMKPGEKTGSDNQFYLFEYHNCVAGDIIELEFQEGGGSNVFDADYVYTGHRIG